jgi:hypothetical protein
MGSWKGTRKFAGAEARWSCGGHAALFGVATGAGAQVFVF